MGNHVSRYIQLSFYTLVICACLVCDLYKQFVIVEFHFNSHFSLSFCWQTLSRLKAKGFVIPSNLKVLGEIASG